MTKLSISDLNKLEMWKTKKVETNLQVRRVLGGFLYEYLRDKEVICATFVSTNELSSV